MPKIKTLTEYHKKAMELKYKGNSYQDIAEILQKDFKKSGVMFNEQTIKDWFRTGAMLEGAYETYRIEQDDIHKDIRETAIKAGIQTLERNTASFCNMLVALLASSNDVVKLGAVKEGLDRIMGKAPENINLLSSKTHEESVKEAEAIIASYGDKSFAQILRSLEARPQAVHPSPAVH